MTDSHPPWLNVSQLSKTVWRIEDAGMVSEYLITGDDRALLIDCGWGIGDLAKVVSGLTSLPLTVINTHGHPDHTCGNYQFESVTIHEGDVPMMKNNYNPKHGPTSCAGSRRTRFPKGFPSMPGSTPRCAISPLSKAR